MSASKTTDSGPRAASAGAVRMSGEQRREQLLDVTKRLAVSRGFHAVSIEAVAREAGITRPVVYGHFDDLEDLLDALVIRETSRAVGQLDLIVPTGLEGQDALERLLTSFDTYLLAAEGDPDTWRLVLMPPEGAPAALRTRIKQGREGVITMLSAAVAPAMGTGAESAPDPELLARMISALADESVRLMLTEPERYTRQRLARQARWMLGRLVRPAG